jgi:predicted esterase
MRLRSLVIVAVLSLSLAGCALIAPGGAGPLRYRDQIFSNVTVTKDVTYGSAPDQSGTTQTRDPVRFLRANAATYHVDPDRISIGGSSAGAITALHVGFETSDFGTSGNPGFSSSVRAAISLSGASVIVAPHAGGADSLLFHGTADPLVPYQWAVNTNSQALAAGLPSELITWQGAGHVPYTQHRQEILDDTTNFLYWSMDLMTAET